MRGRPGQAGQVGQVDRRLGEPCDLNQLAGSVVSVGNKQTALTAEEVVFGHLHRIHADAGMAGGVGRWEGFTVKVKVTS